MFKKFLQKWLEITPDEKKSHSEPRPKASPVKEYLRLKRAWKGYEAGECFEVGTETDTWNYEKVDNVLYPEIFELVTFDPNAQ